MAVQGFYFRTSTLLNSCRFLLNNRTPQFTQVAGVKKKYVDALTALKVPEKPKKPLTPYFRFIKERRSSIVKQYPHWQMTQVSVQCGSEWKALDATAKAKYENDFKKEMEVYAKKYEEYLNSLTEDQKKAIKEYKTDVKKSRERREQKQKLRELQKPKRPAGAYLLYVLEQAKLQKDKPYTELLSELKGKWSEIPAGDKLKYTQEAAKARNKYLEDLKKWEKEMIEQGNADVVRQTTLTGKSPKVSKE